MEVQQTGLAISLVPRLMGCPSTVQSPYTSHAFPCLSPGCGVFSRLVAGCEPSHAPCWCFSQAEVAAGGRKEAGAEAAEHEHEHAERAIVSSRRRRRRPPPPPPPPPPHRSPALRLPASRRPPPSPQAERPNRTERDDATPCPLHLHAISSARSAAALAAGTKEMPCR